MIFISYRRSDSHDLVRSLDADLTREFGEDIVFRDNSRLEGGQDWTKELEENAKNCRVMLVVIGATWQSDAFTEGDSKGYPRLSDPEDWVRKEITFALDASNTVIPVFLNDAIMPSRGWLKNCQLERLYKQQGERLRSNEYANDLAKLITVLRKQCPELPDKSEGPGDPPPAPGIPVPPEVYAVPNYILTSKFIGRATELDLLDDWVCSDDPLMVVEGIGGLGKSALTWEWMQNRAPHAIDDLAGRMWWSFYERGTSMSDFVRHALAYVTGQDPASLSEDSSHYERCQELLTRLKRRPFLLVLDGFERVLTAYHRWDKAQQRDDHVDATLRECVEPRDGEFLQQLLYAGPSKVMLSTRLYPSVLEDTASGQPIPGVSFHHLNGLSRPDALDFFRHAGIKGNEKAMLDFAGEFGYHSLVLKVLCGEIAGYPRQPFNFDAWSADPIYGGKVKLSELDDRKQLYNRILHIALEGLGDQKKKLLSRIAVLSENVNYDTLSVLNPFLPPRPDEVRPPLNPMEHWRWEILSDTLNNEETQEWLAEYEKTQESYRVYQKAITAYYDSAEYRQAIKNFDKALKELQDRGLLQWDRDTGHYDMHPVVRGHAAELLEDSDRKQTYLTVRDHIGGLPPDDLNKATELSQISNKLEIYRCLIGAELFDNAFSFYRGAFANTLFHHLGAHNLIIELLKPLFEGGKDGVPCLKSANDQAFVLNDMAFALRELGRHDEAIPVYAKSLQICLDKADWQGATTRLSNIAFSAQKLNRRAESAAAFELALELCEVSGRKDGVTKAFYDHAWVAIEQGRFADGNQLLSDFHDRPLPPLPTYRPGDAELWACFSQYYQGKMTEADWQQNYEIAMEHRNVVAQYGFLALRCEWLLLQDQPKKALEDIDEALKIVNRLGSPKPGYHDLRAWTLARLNREDDARGELVNGEQRRYAAEAWRSLGELEQARNCALNAYLWAWGEGPPYIHWYELERSRALLKEFGEPEPQLPLFDPGKVQPIPHEKEIRAAIAKLKAEKESRGEKKG